MSLSLAFCFLREIHAISELSLVEIILWVVLNTRCKWNLYLDVEIARDAFVGYINIPGTSLFPIYPGWYYLNAVWKCQELLLSAKIRKFLFPSYRHNSILTYLEILDLDDTLDKNLRNREILISNLFKTTAFCIVWKSLFRVFRNYFYRAIICYFSFFFFANERFTNFLEQWYKLLFFSILF